jgi:hypothetical protein
MDLKKNKPQTLHPPLLSFPVAHLLSFSFFFFLFPPDHDLSSGPIFSPTAQLSRPTLSFLSSAG